jgi:large subunit ribosomal protein L18
MAITVTQRKVARRLRIRLSIRRKINGTTAIPRLSVFRSNKYIYAKLVDDVSGHTLASASSKDKDIDASGNKTDVSKRVGAALAKKAVEAGFQTVVFDRGGYLYHGRVKALAEGAREGGLKF